MNSERNDARWAGCNTSCESPVSMEDATRIADAVYDHTVTRFARKLWDLGFEDPFEFAKKHFDVRSHP